MRATLFPAAPVTLPVSVAASQLCASNLNLTRRPQIFLTGEKCAGVHVRDC